jgi:opine dehydrogenase
MSLRSPDARRRTVCVCGGGSLAHALAAVFGADPQNEVRVLTRQPRRWGSVVRAIYLDRAEIVGRIAIASDKPEIVEGSDVVVLAVPQVGIDSTLRVIRPHVTKKMWLGAMPGYGGIDWRVRALLGGATPFFGLQRVPYVRKTIAYGECVWISGIRPKLFVAAIPATRTVEARALVEELLGIPTKPLSSYLAINLTTTNPTFHPARIYALFRGRDVNESFDQITQFYEDWDDAASEIFLALDKELHFIARALPGGVEGLMGIEAHYGVRTAPDLTKRIRAIRALRDRPVPLRLWRGRLIADLDHPSFSEDIPFGLLPIRGIAEVASVKTPVMDSIILWAGRWLGQQFIDTAGSLVTAGSFPTPRRFGLNTPEAIVSAAKQ